MPMALRIGRLDNDLAAIDSVLSGIVAGSRQRQTIERFRADLAAVRFHLKRPPQSRPLLGILGGTGTGKSTLLNRLLGSDVTAASFRRTFTAGPIAVTADPSHIPDDWLGIPHYRLKPEQIPARGQLDRLVIVVHETDLTRRVSLVDTPDLDGDQPAHHAQADRVFRWADAVLFLVTPEKYQMTELLPYYRMARRYGLPALYVMNKVEQQAVVDDYASQMESPVYAIPRDDAAYEPDASANLQSLQNAIAFIEPGDRSEGAQLRTIDLMGRLKDHITEPMRQDRRFVDRLIRALRAMESPAPGVDVNPLTQQLQRRLQQRSVLYLMGPGRVLDRVRQVPGMLARLPRTTWDLLRSGRLSSNGADEPLPDLNQAHPDFRGTLVDQFNVVQSRIDELLRSEPASAQWIDQPGSDYAESKLDPSLAGRIADEEIASLQQWLEHQWNATPRDTAMIERLLAVLPGGKALSKWSEAAPYLLAIVVATHHAFFGPLDLMIIGGFSLATWLSEKLSNQVASRARTANSAIASRFADLTHQQIDRTCDWLNRHAVDESVLTRLEGMANEISSGLERVAGAKG